MKNIEGNDFWSKLSEGSMKGSEISRKWPFLCYRDFNVVSDDEAVSRRL